MLPGLVGRDSSASEPVSDRTITGDKEKKKSISRSTVERAMKTALEMEGKVPGPKALNVPGAHSYLYPIFVRFGVIK